jgi:hypothetical protein
MDPIVFGQLNEAYHRGVYGQETLSEEDYLDIQEWVEALIDEGYDLDQYSDDELYEAFVSPYKDRFPTYNNPHGHSPQMKAHVKSEKLRQSEPGSPRQKKQTARSLQLNRLAKAARDTIREDIDLYDLVSEYLVSEGFCDSYEDADVIMANMSEEWREGIVEEVLDEELTGPRREYALNKAKKLRSLAISSAGGRTKHTRTTDISRNLDVRAGKLERLAANTQGRGWENQPRKRGGSGVKGDPKEMDYGVTHDRSQKTPTNLIKSKLLKRAKREINRR